MFQQQAQHNIIPAGVAYLQAPYHDELSDFRITPSPGGPMLDHRYQDDSANMVYGYVSSPYGTTNPAGTFLVRLSKSIWLLKLFNFLKIHMNKFECIHASNLVHSIEFDQKRISENEICSTKNERDTNLIVWF